MLTQFGAALRLSLVGALAQWSGGYSLPFLITGTLALLAACAAATSSRYPRREAMPAHATD